jgi:hypothetical protein
MGSCFLAAGAAICFVVAGSTGARAEIDCEEFAKSALGPRVAAGNEPVVRVGPLAINLASRSGTIDGKRVVLGPKEYLVLQILAQHAGKVVTRQQIMKGAPHQAATASMPRSIGRLSASALSHHGQSSAVFITNIAESEFRHTQPARDRAWGSFVPSVVRPTSISSQFSITLFSPKFARSCDGHSDQGMFARLGRQSWPPQIRALG